MAELNMENIQVWMEFMAEQMGVKLDPKHTDAIRLWSQKNAEITADFINKTTADQLLNSLLEASDDDKQSAIKKVFEIAIGVRALQIARTRVNTLSNHGIYSGANFGSEGNMTKTWMLGAGKNHRDTHLKVAGETVGVREKFSNGLLYPGDTGNAFSAAEIANCGCYLKWNKPN